MVTSNIQNILVILHFHSFFFSFGSSSPISPPPTFSQAINIVIINILFAFWNLFFYIVHSKFWFHFLYVRSNSFKINLISPQRSPLSLFFVCSRSAIRFDFPWMLFYIKKNIYNILKDRLLLWVRNLIIFRLCYYSELNWNEMYITQGCPKNGMSRTIRVHCYSRAKKKNEREKLAPNSQFNSGSVVSYLLLSTETLLYFLIYIIYVCVMSR